MISFDISQSKEQQSTNNRVAQMLQAFFDPTAEKEKRSAAANNLFVLGRDAPAQLFQVGVVYSKKCIKTVYSKNL